MQNARIESESIIQQAEERARVLTSEQEIVKRSQQHAVEILSAAQKSAKELTRKATLYCETILKNSEEVLGRSMADIKNTRMNLRSAARPKKPWAQVKEGQKALLFTAHFCPKNLYKLKKSSHRVIRCGVFCLGQNFAACCFDANRCPWGGGLCTKCEKSIHGAVFSSSPLLLPGKMVLLFYHRWVIVVRLTTKVVNGG